MRINNFSVSEFYCVQCGNKGMPIPRTEAKKREFGHMKKLYCLHCKEEVNHIEIVQFGTYTKEQFKKDYEAGKFKDIKTYKEIVQ